MPAALRLKAILSAFFSVVLDLDSRVKERGKLSLVSSTLTRFNALKGGSFPVTRFHLDFPQVF